MIMERLEETFGIILLGTLLSINLSVILLTPVVIFVGIPLAYWHSSTTEQKTINK
jgi:hypothetical protein